MQGQWQVVSTRGEVHSLTERSFKTGKNAPRGRIATFSLRSIAGGVVSSSKRINGKA